MKEDAGRGAQHLAARRKHLLGHPLIQNPYTYNKKIINDFFNSIGIFC